METPKTTIKKVQRRQLTGTVVTANKTPKTVIVRVDRTEIHPKYGKRYIVSRRFMAHDEDMTTKLGSTVIIEETRPLSARKRWRVITAVAKA